MGAVHLPNTTGDGRDRNAAFCRVHADLCRQSCRRNNIRTPRASR
jgi:hypothetical protein